MSRERRYLWLDVETTGLDPSEDLLLEVAAWPTASDDPLDLAEGGLRRWVIGHDHANLGMRMVDPVVWRMHGESGLLADVVESKLGAEVVQKALVDLVEMPDPGADWHLAGNSVHFDLSFLRADMPRFAKKLSHRILDVSSFLLLAKSLGRDVPRPPVAHRAAADVESSIRQFAEVCRWLGTNMPGMPTPLAVLQ